MINQVSFPWYFADVAKSNGTKISLWSNVLIFLETTITWQRAYAIRTIPWQFLKNGMYLKQTSLNVGHHFRQWIAFVLKTKYKKKYNSGKQFLKLIFKNTQFKAIPS